MLRPINQGLYRAGNNFIKIGFIGGLLTMLSSSLALAAPAMFLDQASISGVGNKLKATRVPVRDAANKVRYYDIEMNFQINSLGAPVLAPSNPIISLSPNLIVGKFIAGKYKDGAGNVYTVTGPGAAPGGRATWNIQLSKQCSSGCGFDELSGSWTTGAIAGHPIQPILTEQGITTSTYSWGIVTEDSVFQSQNCSGDAIGFIQSGNQIAMNGYCAHTAIPTDVVTLNLCTATNPCP